MDVPDFDHRFDKFAVAVDSPTPVLTLKDFALALQLRSHNVVVTSVIETTVD